LRPLSRQAPAPRSKSIAALHGGYLAIDSGADYTDTESPHYLNYYRRTVAHNSVLVYDPGEKFFWSSNLLPAANDGGQRMDSSRYWNTVRNLEDFRNTRDLWDLGSMRVVDFVPGQYHYALGDASNAYSREKLKTFTREIVYVPAQDLLFVFDRVVSTHPSFKKAWLLHGVNPPSVDQDRGQEKSKDFRQASTFCFRDGSGEVLVHSLLPRERGITRRGGPGADFYAPGDDHGGGWGSGENWPLEPPEGAPLPEDSKARHMWKTFWGEDFDRILGSNRKKRGARSLADRSIPFRSSRGRPISSCSEIGDRGKTGNRRTELVAGDNFVGAASEGGPFVLFGTSVLVPAPARCPCPT